MPIHNAPHRKHAFPPITPSLPSPPPVALHNLSPLQGNRVEADRSLLCSSELIHLPPRLPASARYTRIAVRLHRLMRNKRVATYNRFSDLIAGAAACSSGRQSRHNLTNLPQTCRDLCPHPSASFSRVFCGSRGPGVMS